MADTPPHGMLSWIGDSWTGLLAIAGGLVGWGDMRRRVSNIEDNVKRIEKDTAGKIAGIDDYGARFRGEMRQEFAEVKAAIGELTTSVKVLAVQKKDKE